MSRPWMPLYIGDYLRDTGHLTTLQHGAYILLIMEYWTKGQLPQNESKLRAICRLSPRQWQSNSQAIAGMFLPGWRQKRVEDELEKLRIISLKRAVFGAAGGRASRGKNNLQRFISKHLPSKS